jgi:hypothetical protein
LELGLDGGAWWCSALRRIEEILHPVHSGFTELVDQPPCSLLVGVRRGFEDGFKHEADRVALFDDDPPQDAAGSSTTVLGRRSFRDDLVRTFDGRGASSAEAGDTGVAAGPA